MSQMKNVNRAASFSQPETWTFSPQVKVINNRTVGAWLAFTFGDSADEAVDMDLVGADRGGPWPCAFSLAPPSPMPWLCRFW